MAARPVAVAFDVVQTLMSLEPLRARFEQVGQPGWLLELWFARLIGDGIGLSLAGDYRPFPEVAAAALREATRHQIDDAAAEHVLAGLAESPAYPDAAPAMATLTHAGMRMICLTNGTAAATAAFLDRVGLAGYIERVVSCEEVGSWKPPARVYTHAADLLGLPVARVALVAAHAWDCHGAHRAGMTTGWVSRLEGQYGQLYTPADVTGDTLVEVAEGLLALPAT